MILLLLSCSDKLQADSIATTLLQKRLIACAKQLPITSQFLWNGSIDSAHEILLLMETLDAYFDAIEQEIAQLHSYDTFVLTALPIQKISKDARQWIEKTLQ